MTVEGTTVVRIVAPSREEQLQAEVNDLHAQIELKQAQLEEAHQALALAAPGAPVEQVQDPICVGGGIVQEADGWLWLERAGEKRRLWRASPEEVDQANAVRAQIRREAEARVSIRRRYAS